MKLSVATVLCLSLLLVHIHLSLAGKSKLSLNPFKKTVKTKTNLDAKTNKAKQPIPNKGSYPKQPEGGYADPGRYPQHPGRGYPQYPNQPVHHPYDRGYPHYPGYTNGGGYSVYQNYPGSYINHNPNNKILSPHYGGSFGYGGYGGGGGSPFSHSVQHMGFAPSDKSKGFGRSAVIAAAGGAMAGMALGYGLGRFPRPQFDFHSPQEEYYYNYYMYRRYGIKSTDRNDYSRDYQFSQPPETFDSYMTSCIKRTDLLPGENRRSETKPLTTTTKTTTTTSATTTTTSPKSNMISNTTAAGNFSLTSNSTNNPLNKSEVYATTLKASQILHNNEANDDTVSIVEIGYPALIKQMKVKRCTELYIVYSEKHLKKKLQHSPGSGAQRLQIGWYWLLSVLISTTMMVIDCNMLMLHN